MFALSTLSVVEAVASSAPAICVAGTRLLGSLAAFPSGSLTHAGCRPAAAAQQFRAFNSTHMAAQLVNNKRKLLGVAGQMSSWPAVPAMQLRGAATSSTSSSAASKTFGEGYVAMHPGLKRDHLTPEERESFMEHPVYSKEYVESIQPWHKPPATLHDRLGFNAVLLMRRTFDWATGYGPDMNEAKWLQRMIFLETVAGVPGMVAGMLRHLRSLRKMRPDKGWIHCLLEEAENERMHLLTFFELRQPGAMFRAMVILAQGIFFNAYFIAYMLSPKSCHAFVGYLEEEAVKTYTHALKDIDEGKLWAGKKAPAIAVQYWNLAPESTMRDVILAVRADEACHSHVNATLKNIEGDAANPFAGNSQSQLP